MAELQVDTDAVVVALRCKGDLDLSTSDALGDVIDRVIAEGVNWLVIDLSKLGHTSSRGLGVLIGARKLLMERGGGLAILNPSDSARASLDVLGLDTVFPVTATVAEAVKALGT